MFADHRFVRAAAARISRAAETTCTALAEGLITSRSVFTDRLLRHMAKEVDRFRSGDLRWRARALIASDTEDDFAAEMVGVLEVDLPDFSVRKGFLATALALPGAQPPAHEDLDELRDACAQMLAMTPASYVFIYRPQGVIVVPAGAAAGSAGRPDRLHRRQLGRFYEEHFSCFIGDAGVASDGDLSLDELAGRHRARTGLALHVELASTPRQESLFRR